MYSLGQNVLDKLTKLNKMGFYRECFVAHFLQFSFTSSKIFLLRGELGACLQFQAFQGFA